MFPSYRNQSIGNVYGKSTDWFLYDGSIGLKWVNKTQSFK